MVLGQEQQPGELVRDELISTNGRADHILLSPHSQPKLFEANLSRDKLAAELLGRYKFGRQAERLILHRSNGQRPDRVVSIVLLHSSRIGFTREMIPTGCLVLASLGTGMRVFQRSS